MKCVKCGYEYKEGRFCPGCGEPAVIISGDYYRRRQEWEERNLPAEEDSAEEKRKIHISGECIKKIIAGIIVMCIAAALIRFVISLAAEYIRVNPFKIVMDAEDSGDMLYTCDGLFAYEMESAFSGITQEFQQQYCSSDGKAAAGVLYEEAVERYRLYVSFAGESRLLYEDTDEIQILRVNCDGSVLFRCIEYGDYNVVLNTCYIEAGNSELLLSEEGCTMIETGEDHVYCFISSEGTVSVWQNGRTGVLCYDVRYSSAAYAMDEFYYAYGGRLYDSGGTLIDEDISEKSLRTVFGTGELFYMKNDTVRIVTQDMKIHEIRDEDAILSGGEVLRVLRKGSSIYVILSDNLIKIDMTGKKMAVLSDVTNIFFKIK